MNRLQINTIIALMSISLIGIIAVQLLWIRNAIEVKEAQFDRATIQAMNDAIIQVESYDAAHYISNNVKLKNSEDSDSFTLVSADSLFDIKLNDSIFNEFIYINNKGEDHSDKTKVIVSVTSSDTSSFKLKKDESGRVWTSKTELISPTKEELHIIAEAEEIEILPAPHKQKNIEYRFSTISRAVKQLVFEYATEEESIKSRLDLARLDKIIRSELHNKSLPMNFDYAITNDKIDSTYIVKSENFKDEYLDSKYKVNVFPHDLSQKSSFLILSFPDKNAHLFKSVYVLSLGSLFFTIIIVITFSLTIYFILKQKKVSEIKTDFINNMTHEFKTPIATISLATDSINNPKIINNEDQVQFYTGIIKEENRRMNAQVENILQMSLIDKKELELNIKTHNIHALIEKALQNINLHIATKNGVISSNLEATNTNALVDEIHFINVLNNLFDNAIKYSAKAPMITLSSENHEDEIRIRIQDQGMGMSNDKLKKIFDKFYRVQMGNIHNIKGFGLGLSYVKAVLDSFKGRIEVQSEPGKGSTFIVILPNV